MKRLLYLLFILAAPAVAQVTDGTLGTQNTSTIYGQGYSPKRAGDMHQAIIDSKVNKRTPVFLDSADITKRIKFQLNGLTTGTTHTVTWPNKGGTVALLDDVSGLSKAGNGLTIAGDSIFISGENIGFPTYGNFVVQDSLTVSNGGFDPIVTFKDDGINFYRAFGINVNSNDNYLSASIQPTLGTDFRTRSTYLGVGGPWYTDLVADFQGLYGGDDVWNYQFLRSYFNYQTITGAQINLDQDLFNISNDHFLISSVFGDLTLSGNISTNINSNGFVSSFGADSISLESPVIRFRSNIPTAGQVWTAIDGTGAGQWANGGITGTTGTTEGAVVTATTVDGVVIAEEYVSITTNGANTTLITQIEPTTDSLALVADFVKVHSGNFSILTAGQTETLAVSSYDGASTLSVNRSTRSTNIAGLLPGIEVAVNTTVDASYISNCLHHTGPSAIDVTIPADLQDKSVITFIQRSTGAINLVEGANVQINGKTSTTGAWDMIWLYLVYKSGGTSYYVGR